MRNETMSRPTAHEKINFLTSLKKYADAYYVLKNIMTDVQLPLDINFTKRHTFTYILYNRMQQTYQDALISVKLNITKCLHTLYQLQIFK